MRPSQPSWIELQKGRAALWKKSVFKDLGPLLAQSSTTSFFHQRKTGSGTFPRFPSTNSDLQFVANPDSHDYGLRACADTATVASALGNSAGGFVVRGSPVQA